MTTTPAALSEQQSRKLRDEWSTTTERIEYTPWLEQQLLALRVTDNYLREAYDRALEKLVSLQSPQRPDGRPHVDALSEAEITDFLPVAHQPGAGMRSRPNEGMREALESIAAMRKMGLRRIETCFTIADKALALPAAVAPGQTEFTKGGGLSFEGATRTDDRGDRATEETGADRPAAPIYRGDQCPSCQTGVAKRSGVYLRCANCGWTGPDTEAAPAPIETARGEELDAALDALIHAVRSDERSNDKYTRAEIQDARRAVAALSAPSLEDAQTPSYAALAFFVRGIADYERYATRDNQEDEAKAHAAILRDIEHEARRLAGVGNLDAAIDAARNDTGGR